MNNYDEWKDNIFKHIFIVNGKPRAGKDTFAQLLYNYAEVYKISIIDPIKALALELGWKGGKEEKDRKFLAELKTLADDYSDYSYEWVKEKIFDFWKDEIFADVLLIDMREPKDIDRFKEEFSIKTVYIENDRVPDITSNEADANVTNYEYDYIIQNNGTMQQFDENVGLWFDEILNGGV